MAGLIEELKRRNVFKVGAAYIVLAWLLAQAADLAAETFEAPGWVMKMLVTLPALLLPLVLFFAWAFELTPEGIKKEKDVDRSQSITPQTRFSEKGPDTISQAESEIATEPEQGKLYPAPFHEFFARTPVFMSCHQGLNPEIPRLRTYANPNLGMIGTRLPL